MADRPVDERSADGGLEGAPEELSPRVFAVLVAIMALLATIPIFANSIPPFFDYPNHLARIAILRDLNGPLGTYFQANVRFLPNLGMDAVMLGFSAILPLERAGQVSIALVAVLFVTGFARLHTAVHGRRTVWALAGALALYTLPLFFGFLNFVLGLSLVMHVLAIRVRMKPGVSREAFGVVAGFALLLCHLLGLGFALLLGPVFDRLTGRSWKASLMGDLAFLPALLATLLFSPRPEKSEGIVLSPLSLKWLHLMTTFVSGHPKLDFAFLGLAILAMAVLLVSRRASIRPAFLIPWAIFVVLWLALPFGISGTANLDARFPATAALFLLIALRPGRIAFARGTAAVLVGLMLFRVGTLAVSYRQDAVVTAEIRRQLAALPPGAVIVPVRDRSALMYDPMAWRPPLGGQAFLATLNGHYVAGTFDEPSQQPIVMRPGWEGISEYRMTDDVPKELASLRRDVAGLARDPGPVWVYQLQKAAKPGRPPEWRLFPLNGSSR